MKKEELVAKGLSEEHAQIAVNSYKEAMKSFIPKKRFDEVNDRLKAANAIIGSMKRDNPDKEAFKDKLTVTLSTGTVCVIETLLEKEGRR